VPTTFALALVAAAADAALELVAAAATPELTHRRRVRLSLAQLTALSLADGCMHIAIVNAMNSSSTQHPPDELAVVAAPVPRLSSSSSMLRSSSPAAVALDSVALVAATADAALELGTAAATLELTHRRRDS
jgi:hypothetical protein